MKKKKHGGAALMLIGAVLLVLAAALTIFNMRRQTSAGEDAENVLSALATAMETQTPPETAEEPSADAPSEELALPPEKRTMPTYEIEGIQYLGVLEIPKLDVQLPVAADWDYDKLQIAPCRYTGSVYTDDLVIAAHNYTTHFGGLSELSVGDEIRFYGADGTVYTYVASAFETLQPTEVENMTVGEYPLTLFTCTWGGASRVTLRCDRYIEN